MTSISASYMVASNGRRCLWSSCEVNSSYRDGTMLSSIDSSMRFTTALISASSISICCSMLMLFEICAPLYFVYGSSMFRCLRLIFCRVLRVRLRVLDCMPVWECKRERGIETILVVSRCRRVILCLYRLVNDAPRPSEYGMCCRFGWLVLAISSHVDVHGCVPAGTWYCVCVCGPHVRWFPGRPSWLEEVGRGSLCRLNIFCTIPM